jgi:hypothetical protein
MPCRNRLVGMVDGIGVGDWYLVFGIWYLVIGGLKQLSILNSPFSILKFSILNFSNQNGVLNECDGVSF